MSSIALSKLNKKEDTTDIDAELAECQKQIKKCQSELDFINNPDKQPTKFDIEAARAYPIGDLLGKPPKVMSSILHFYPCVFHNEKSPSMAVRVDKNKFKCYGCGQYGSVIDIYMKMHNATLVEALKFLSYGK